MSEIKTLGSISINQASLVDTATSQKMQLASSRATSKHSDTTTLNNNRTLIAVGDSDAKKNISLVNEFTIKKDQFNDRDLIDFNDKNKIKFTTKYNGLMSTYDFSSTIKTKQKHS